MENVMKLWVVSLISALLVIGCATPQKVLWDKPGGTPEDFRRDNYESTQQSMVSWSGGGTGTVGLVIMAGAQAQAQKQANALYRMCMEARGWTGYVQPNEALKEIEKPRSEIRELKPDRSSIEGWQMLSAGTLSKVVLEKRRLPRF
jgi:hypothetical protein